MSNNSNRTALVTGANAGLGFEAAAQLAEDGWGKVILACRTAEKAEAARKLLVERTGKDPYSALAIDTSEVAPAQAAVDELAARGAVIDFLLLNAGASKKDPSLTSQGYEITYASTLVGHHVLTMGALGKGLLGPKARIVIAGSEGSRGNMPGMGLQDVAKLAATHHEGDRSKAIESLVKLELPEQKPFVNMREYVTAKLIVAWWAAELAKKLPQGMTVNCVSPGANLGTTFARDAPAMMRAVMMPFMKLMGPILGMDGPVENGARRYLDAAERADDDTGHTYATANPKKFVGPVGLQTKFPQFFDAESFEPAWDAMVSLTGVGFPVSDSGASEAAAKG